MGCCSTKKANSSSFSEQTERKENRYIEFEDKDDHSSTKEQDLLDYQPKTIFYSYLNVESQQSLLRDFILWTLKNALLFAVISLCNTILVLFLMTVLIIIWYGKKIWSLIGIYVIYVILGTTLPALYYLHLILPFHLITGHYHIDALYTVAPLLLSVLFKDAIIVYSKLRVNLKRNTYEIQIRMIYKIESIKKELLDKLVELDLKTDYTFQRIKVTEDKNKTLIFVTLFSVGNVAVHWYKLHKKTKDNIYKNQRDIIFDEISDKYVENASQIVVQDAVKKLNCLLDQDEKCNMRIDDPLSCYIGRQEDNDNENMLISTINKFIGDYSIWGRTLSHYYVPLGDCVVAWPVPDTIPFESLLQQSLENESYSSLDKHFKKAMTLFTILLAILPTVFFFIHHLSDPQFHVSGLIAFFGMFYLLFVVVAINDFIEIIFEQLITYYRYMSVLTERIEIMSDQCRKFNFYQNQDDNKEYVDGGGKKRSFAIDIPSISNTHTPQDKVLLFEGENYFVWFENWCRIQNITSEYFENRQTIVFALFTILIISFTCILYFYMNSNIINAMTVSIFGGFIYSLIVLVRLLLYAFKMSSLELKQTRLIKTQQMYFNHVILIQTAKNVFIECKEEDEPQTVTYFKRHQRRDTREFDDMHKVNDNMDNKILQHLAFMIEQIELRSLCPKLAGVTLDKALVNMAITSFVSIGSVLLTYTWNQVKSYK